MDSFVQKYNESEPEVTYKKPLAPFIGDPKDLHITAQQELTYRYQFLEESVISLAEQYRLTPRALELWIKEKGLRPKSVVSEDELAAFEDEVNSIYKSLRVRLSGLVALSTAKTWHTLARVEEDLLLALKSASAYLRDSDFLDVKSLQTLVNIHTKLTDKHLILQKAVEIPANQETKEFVDSVSKSLNQLFAEIDGSSYELPSK